MKCNLGCPANISTLLSSKHPVPPPAYFIMLFGSRLFILQSKYLIFCASC